MMALTWKLTGSLASQPDFIPPGKAARMADW